MRNKVYWSLLLGLVLFASCKPNTVYHEFQNIKNERWEQGHKLLFHFEMQDTLSKHHIYIHLRNTENYAFSNLFLITKMQFPNGTVVKDTLEYAMTDAEGYFLGKGYTSIKENKLWYKENVVFESSNVYTLEIEHAMRKNGNIEGVAFLKGIDAVGVEIEKNAN